MDTQPRIVLNYVHGDDIGYGRVGAGLAAALRRRGVEVVDEPGAGGRASPLPPRVVTWISSPFHAVGCWEQQRPVVVTMWETDQLPRSFRRTLRRFTTVIVPSDENLELFSEFHPDVRRMSFGVDTQRWRPTPRPDGADFVFLCAGSGRRKGVDLAHDAFMRAFPAGRSTSGPRPRLVLKGRHTDRYAGESVRVITQTLSTDEERAVYDAAHCYVQPSRGEGFGLQPLQAIAAGIPTILTDAHGHRAYSRLGLPVAARKVPSDLFVFGESGHWWEADLDELVDAMRWVYEHYDVAIDRAAASAADAARTFSWEVAARQLLVALGGETALANPLATTGPWRSFGEPVYPIVTRRDVTIRSAGADHEFTAGRDTSGPAHVKRLLFESGLLDERCVHVPLRALSAAERERLTPAQCDEYEAWVAEAKRAPGRDRTATG